MTPDEYRAKKAEWHRRWLDKHRDDPDYRAKRREYARKQYARPERRAYLREYQRARYHGRVCTAMPTTRPDAGTRVCVGCDKPFVRTREGDGRLSQAKTCSEQCRRQAIRRTQLAGKSCRISVGPCAFCGEPFTQRADTGRKHCSDACRANAHQERSAAIREATRDARLIQRREQAREYQRRTRYTAIRYWAIDNSPLALEVARLQYELRQQLRAGR